MQSDLEKLQGTWNVTALESDGKKLPEITYANSTIVVKGNSFISTGMGAPYEGIIELNPRKKLKTFDVLFTEGHAKGTRHLGIYKLDDEAWTICFATQGTERPDSFSSAGSGVVVETLARTRSKPSESVNPPERAETSSEAESAGPVTELEGDWQMTFAVFNGVAMDEMMVKWCKRLTHVDVTKVTAGPQVFLNARFTLDTSNDPRHIDYVLLQGADKGKSQTGIYALSGDELKVCVAAPGKARPDDFSSKPGDQRNYTTWRRIKE
jgi:uncharacterized protein (TIGR03067 family)